MSTHEQQPMADRTAGWQSWRSLAFLHWRVAPELLQRLIPPSLTIQTWDGTAWIGVVPFSMQRVRPWWSPPVPGISWFLETNVRTYVVDSLGRSGVWFFSLDANSRLAVLIARRFWHLPYVYSSLQLQSVVKATQAADPNTAQSNNPAEPVPRCGERLSGAVTYSGHRLEKTSAEYDIRVQWSDRALTTAAPGSVEEFLLERYVLFAHAQDGGLRIGRVHHSPYTFVPCQCPHVRQSLIAAAGCDVDSRREPDHVVWSPGVDVRVSALTE